MKAVMPIPLPDAAALRKCTGIDKWDEMWDGVLHMPPMPNRAHQNFEFDLEAYLRKHWARPRGAKVYHGINVAFPGGWPADYRVPDLVLLTPERFQIDCNEYFDGPPDLLIEIHSPGDETYEKLAWYAALGVPEVWIIHRDTKEPEIHLLRKGRYRKQRVLANGWLRSPATGVELRRAQGDKLGSRLAGNDATREDLPLD